MPTRFQLEMMIKELGGTPKQLRKARMIFVRSCRQAGMIDEKTKNFRMPKYVTHDEITEPKSVVHEILIKPSNNDLHPLIQGLLMKLPEPHAEWSTQQRMAWLETAKNIFGLLYHTDAEKNQEIEIRKVSGNNKMMSVELH